MASTPTKDGDEVSTKEYRVPSDSLAGDHSTVPAHPFSSLRTASGAFLAASRPPFNVRPKPAELQTGTTEN